jgi:class 3 adenylate cyclase
MKRKIAAILAADAPDFSRQMTMQSAVVLAQLETARTVFTKTIAAHEGRIFNTAGASILAEFSSSVEAVRCALSVQRNLVNQNAGRVNAELLAFRIGITVGDIVERDGDLLGDAVNIAARLSQRADNNSVCVSLTVYDQVRGKVDIQSVDLGPQTFKNIPDRVHAVMLTAGTGRVQPAIAGRPASERPPWMWVGLSLGVALVVVLVWTTMRSPRADKQPIGVQSETTRPGTGDAIDPTVDPKGSGSAGGSDRAVKAQRCAEILERIQAGSGSPEDRKALQASCL